MSGGCIPFFSYSERILFSASQLGISLPFSTFDSQVKLYPVFFPASRNVNFPRSLRILAPKLSFVSLLMRQIVALPEQQCQGSVKRFMLHYFRNRNSVVLLSFLLTLLCNRSTPCFHLSSPIICPLPLIMYAHAAKAPSPSMSGR